MVGDDSLWIVIYPHIYRNALSHHEISLTVQGREEDIVFVETFDSFIDPGTMRSVAHRNNYDVVSSRNSLRNERVPENWIFGDCVIEVNCDPH